MMLYLLCIAVLVGYVALLAWLFTLGPWGWAIAALLLVTGANQKRSRK